MADINTASLSQVLYFLHAKLHDFPHSLRIHFEKTIAPYHSLFSATRHTTEKVLFTIDFDRVPLRTRPQTLSELSHALFTVSVLSVLKKLLLFRTGLILYLISFAHTCICL